MAAFRYLTRALPTLAALAACSGGAGAGPSTQGQLNFNVASRPRAGAASSTASLRAFEDNNEDGAED